VSGGEIADKCVIGYTPGANVTLSNGTYALATCANATSQRWTHQTNGEYVLKLNSLCLTDPGDSATNGTQVTITKCTAATSQQWALP
jgi:hypothetical protein